MHNDNYFLVTKVSRLNGYMTFYRSDPVSYLSSSPTMKLCSKSLFTLRRMPLSSCKDIYNLPILLEINVK